MFKTWFGKWGNLPVSIFTSLTVVVIAVCACCCAPCIRALILRCMTTTMSSMDSGGLGVPTVYQIPKVKGSGPSNQGCEKEGAVIRLTGLRGPPSEPIYFCWDHSHELQQEMR
ncbi:hypothetical protein XENORESO_006673 [Xenotaenia resolanae]|uniref:Uncharacterized protein n=1 Tax=Xenotaenia resolanae TaxID=208358 RepID=A0ABV0W1I6_9TELE